jgi:hypothetical protein
MLVDVLIICAAVFVMLEATSAMLRERRAAADAQPVAKLATD